MRTIRRGAVLLAAAVLLLAAQGPARASFVDWLGSDEQFVELGGTRIIGGDRLRVRAGESLPGDVYAMVRIGSVSGSIDGDLSLAAAENFSLSGDVLADLNVAAFTVEIVGDVGDDVRAAGGLVNIGGRIGGDALIGAFDTELLPESDIGGSLLITGSTVVLRGRVSGPVRIQAGRVELDAVLGSDAWIACDELKLGPNARVLGDLVYEARNEIANADTFVDGTVSKTQLRQDDPLISFELPPWLWWWIDFYLAVIALIAGTMLVLFFHPLTEGAVSYAGSGTGLAVAFGIGLVSLLVMFVLGLICLLPALPLALAVWSALGALLYFGGLIGKMMLGCLLVRPLMGRLCHPLLALVVGVVAMFLLGLIPYVGDLAWGLTVVTGMGAMLLQIREGRVAVRETVAPTVPPATAAPRP
jgi:cytoskeletal protein CcmA (bactofilin family)